MTITVVIPGALTTIQDLGRAGYGALGVPESGAMDTFALRAANRLVGNSDDTAALEMTMSGVTLRFDEDIVVALTGSRFAALLDDEPAPFERAFAVHAGQTLAVGWTHEGARAYLAVRGGIVEARALGSRSRHVGAELGPPPLSSGDVLVTGSGDDAPLRAIQPGSAPSGDLRAIRGPQWDDFPTHTRFFGESFRVTTDADRTGIRLDGPPIDHAGSGEIEPEGCAFGSVQVPGNGHPIILGPDRPITGGYPKIAVVIAADTGLLAHLKPGDTLRFVEVTIDEARTAWQERERMLNEGIA